MAVLPWLRRRIAASKWLQGICWGIFGGVVGYGINAVDTNWKYAYWGFICGIAVCGLVYNWRENRQIERESAEADERRLARQAATASRESAGPAEG